MCRIFHVTNISWSGHNFETIKHRSIFFFSSTERYICRVDVKIRVRVKGVKRIPICIRRYHYAIEEIFTGANMIMIEFDK